MSTPKDMMQEMQDRVIHKLNADAQAAHQPMAAIDINTWMQIITAVIQAIQQCRAARNPPATPPTTTPAADTANAAIAKSLAHPTLLQKLALHRTMVSNMGRSKFRAHGEAIHEKLLQVSTEATDADRLEFVNQVVAHG